MKRIGIILAVALVSCMCFRAQAQDWDAIGQRILDEMHSSYTSDVDGDDVRGSAAGAATALFVPADIEAGGNPIAGMLGYDYGLSSTHSDGSPWSAPSTPAPFAGASADLWDSSLETSDFASANTLGDTGVTALSSAYQSRPGLGGFPLVDTAGPDTYTWPEVRTELEGQYDGLSAADQADVDAFLDDLVASAEYMEVKDYLLNGAASGAVRADHVVVRGTTPGAMVPLEITVGLTGGFGASASSSTGQSGAASGFVVAGGAANATLEEGIYGAAGMWAHGSGMTEFDTAGDLTPGDLTVVPGGYSINDSFVITVMVPVSEVDADYNNGIFNPFLVGFGVATAAIAGGDPNEPWVMADAYADITAQILGYSLPVGYTIELVPEPSSLALLALGVGGILIRRRKK